MSQTKSEQPMKYPQRGQSSLHPRSNMRASQLGQVRWIFSSAGSGCVDSSGSS
jgi:hypothetical protein